jgi:hypothetical protein
MYQQFSYATDDQVKTWLSRLKRQPLLLLGYEEYEKYGFRVVTVNQPYIDSAGKHFYMNHAGERVYP